MASPGPTCKTDSPLPRRQAAPETRERPGGRVFSRSGRPSCLQGAEGLLGLGALGQGRAGRLVQVGVDGVLKVDRGARYHAGDAVDPREVVVPRCFIEFDWSVIIHR